MDKYNISTMFAPNKNIEFSKEYGNGFDFKTTTDEDGKIPFNLNETNSFCLYRYNVE